MYAPIITSKDQSLNTISNPWPLPFATARSLDMLDAPGGQLQSAGITRPVLHVSVCRVGCAGGILFVTARIPACEGQNGRLPRTLTLLNPCLFNLSSC